ATLPPMNAKKGRNSLHAVLAGRLGVLLHVDFCKPSARLQVLGGLSEDWRHGTARSAPGRTRSPTKTATSELATCFCGRTASSSTGAPWNGLAWQRPDF